MTVLRALTNRPAEILGLPSGRIAQGPHADLILLDTDYPWNVTETNFRSRSRNTSFEGARMTGKVMQTFVAGKSVYQHREA